MSRRTQRIAEVAEDLGVSVSTVKRWVQQGQLRHYRIGSVVLIEQAAVEQFLAAHAEGNPLSTRRGVRTPPRRDPAFPPRAVGDA